MLELAAIEAAVSKKLRRIGGAAYFWLNSAYAFTSSHNSRWPWLLIDPERLGAMVHLHASTRQSPGIPLAGGLAGLHPATLPHCNGLPDLPGS